MRNLPFFSCFIILSALFFRIGDNGNDFWIVPDVVPPPQFKYSYINEEINNTWDNIIGMREKKKFIPWSTMDNLFPGSINDTIAFTIKNTNNVSLLSIGVKKYNQSFINWANAQPPTTFVYLLAKDEYKEIKNVNYRGICVRLTKNCKDLKFKLNLMIYDEINGSKVIINPNVTGGGVTNTGGRIPPRP